MDAHGLDVCLVAEIRMRAEFVLVPVEEIDVPLSGNDKIAGLGNWLQIVTALVRQGECGFYCQGRLLAFPIPELVAPQFLEP